MRRLVLLIPILLLLGPAFAAAAERIVEVIGPAGDGKGNPLRAPIGLARDATGNLFVSGMLSDNVFRIAPDGSVSQVIDQSGDGEGHELAGPRAIAVDADRKSVV